MKNPVLKLSYREEREYAEIEGQISQLEDKLAAVHNKINDAGSDFILLQELTLEQQALEAELTKKIDRWAYLSEWKEKIEKNKGEKD